VTDRYAQYERLRDLALEAHGVGAYELGDALAALARLVLLGREQHAAAALRTVPDGRTETSDEVRDG
jgi:hypothetical protein